MGIKVNLKNVRVNYLDIFTKGKDTVNEKTGEPVKGKFNATIYLDKDHPDLSKLEEAAITELTEKLKSEKAAEKWLDRNYGFGNHSDKCAVRDLAERDKPIEGLEEGLYFKATSQKKPSPIMTSLGEKQTEKGFTVDGDDIEGKEIYNGCYANVSVEVYWYDKFKCLLINILAIKFRADGEAFGGAGETADESDVDDEDDKPSRRKSRSAEDESPRKSRRRDEDEDEEDAPRRRKPRRDEDDDEDEEDERPRRRR